jgi:transposase-like protein
LEVVRQIASGATRPAQACREHGRAERVLLRWRHEHEARGEKGRSALPSRRATR